MNARLAAALLALSLLVGCRSSPSMGRLNAPPQGESDRGAELQKPFVYMVDNALLHDMSVVDLHFVPHTAELNGTGAARLTRMARLLNVYGGIVRYETEQTDDALITRRIAHVHEYLADAGCDMSRVEVKSMLSGGRGIRATDAIRILEEGTINDLQSGAAGSGQPGSTSAQASAQSPGQ